MFDISPVQIMIVLAIALLVFGPKRLPDLGRNLGRGIRDFRDGISGDGKSDSVTSMEDEFHEEPASAATLKRESASEADAAAAEDDAIAGAHPDPAFARASA
ncbi:Sec-independent protein translocase subunit TatA/TatB [Miltoncostaea oceani]|uniref:Sec-independent protein translocase subunit TatA/TatB n=1 Tax=Miltoncostaea oceani TaxID=2843216 RepID=UPI001C3DCC58|nr:twin-arginine translocase TatA/TatE family subunit [Miltoncostaea oceani]